MQGINQYFGVNMRSATFQFHPKTNVDNKAHIIIVGYILFILRLYQFIKLSFLPRNKVNPEQKKNKPSPIAPPVTNPWNLGNSIAMCEYVISNAAINLSKTIP